LSVLSGLQKQFPDSGWARDARALEVEVKQASGQPVSANAANDELKLLALQGLTRTDPEAAFPVIEKMLAGGSSVRVKERALFVLAQSGSTRGQEVLGRIARELAAVHVQGIEVTVVLGGGFLWYAWKLLDPPDEFFAMRTFRYSIVYLMALFAFLLVDHWLLPLFDAAPALEFAPAP